MHAPPPRLRVAVHQQSGNRVELIADVEAKRTDGCGVPQTSADGVAKIIQMHVPTARPHIAGVQEHHGAETAANRGARFRREREHAVSTDREAIDKWAQFVAAPTADAGRTSEEELA